MKKVTTDHRFRASLLQLPEHATVKTNKELADFVLLVITQSGVKKSAIGRRIGVTPQRICELFKKRDFSLDDANRIFDAFSLKITADATVDIGNGNAYNAVRKQAMLGVYSPIHYSLLTSCHGNPTSNAELSDFVKSVLDYSEIPKLKVAENIGMSRQGIYCKLKKRHFSIDDANLILNGLGIMLKLDVILDRK